MSKCVSTPYAFLRRIAPAHGMTQLFDVLTDISVFIKDRRGRFMYLNTHGCEYCGVKHAQDAIGKTDLSFFPQQKAALYMADDSRVMHDGIPVLNRIEPEPCGQPTPRLVVTSKMPLRDTKGKIIGIIGLSREITETRPAAAGIDKVAKVVALFHERYGDALSIAQAARQAGISINHLERLFHMTIGESPQHCLIRIRIEHACRLLRDSRDSLSDISGACGFYDQAHFCHAFTAHVGCPPSAYRRRHQPATEKS
ncbi:MAG: AraC family transcriptional regulator [Kiritimatiellae bacterium]|nr:AraC family transcriptional regulator [Kiritimatiellia bacterium]